MLQYANQLKKFRGCKGKEPAFKVLHNNFVYNSDLLLCNTISKGISYYTIKRLHSFSCVVHQEFVRKLNWLLVKWRREWRKKTPQNGLWYTTNVLP